MTKVFEDNLFHHINVYNFVTNHGSFASYLNRFNKVPLSQCVCGSYQTYLPYFINYTFTAAYHIKKSSNMNLSNWFNYVKKKKNLLHNISLYTSDREQSIRFQSPQAEYHVVHAVQID